MTTAIGIDLGGTNLKGVLLNEAGEVLHQASQSTYAATAGQGGENRQWKQAVAQMVQDLKGKSPSAHPPIGLAAPGLPNATNTAIRVMPGRLEGLENLVWADFLGEKAVWVLNDAQAALMAEASFGAGRGVRNLVLLTLGTGVGGGILINGELYQGNYQMAGHLGHLSLDADREELGITGMPGTLEYAIGNETVPKRSFGRYTATHDLVEAYRQGEPLATYVWLNSVRKLALGICSICNALSPDMVILGGGITKAGEALYGPLATFMGVHSWKNAGQQTPVVQTQHSDMAGAIGAAGFALRQAARAATAAGGAGAEVSDTAF